MKKTFAFQKSYIKVEGYKTFKISSDCHIKRCQSLKRRAILQNWGTAFQRIPCSVIWFLNETSRKKRFRMFRQKLCGTCRKLFERTNHLFLSWLDLSTFLNICTQWNCRYVIRCVNTQKEPRLFFLTKFCFEMVLQLFLNVLLRLPKRLFIKPEIHERGTKCG